MTMLTEVPSHNEGSLFWHHRVRLPFLRPLHHDGLERRRIASTLVAESWRVAVLLLELWPDPSFLLLAPIITIPSFSRTPLAVDG
jgi:hypothetical protein